VTVAVDVLPPGTVVGFKLIDTMMGGVTVKVADGADPFKLAVITAAVGELTPEVVAVNVPVVCPPAIVTDPGAVAATEPLDKLTTTPEEPAAPVSVTVPVTVLPPGTVEGFKLTDNTPGGLIIKVAVFDPLLNPAVMTQLDWEFTGVVVTVNVPVL